MELVKTFIEENKVYLIIWSILLSTAIWKGETGLLFYFACIFVAVALMGVILTTGSLIWSKNNGKRILIVVAVGYLTISVFYAFFVAKPQYIPSALEEYYNQMQERSRYGR